MEALSEREAQLALRDDIENGNIDDFVDNDFEWNNGEKLVATCHFIESCGFNHVKVATQL